MITRRRLFQSGLLAFFAGLLPGTSKANDANKRPDVRCGDRLRIDGLRGLCRTEGASFEGVVDEITIRESIHGTELMLYSLINIDIFPPNSWAYPGYENHVGIHFRNGKWSDGVQNNPLSVKKVGHIAWYWDQNGNMCETNPR